MECRIPPESVNDPNAPALYLGESGGQGISGKTLLRWMKEPEFDTAYRNARRAAFSQSIARLQQMSGAAVATLGKLMVDPSTPASTRARVADSILDHAAKAIEIEDIEVRVAELERAAEASKHGR